MWSAVGGAVAGGVIGYRFGGRLGGAIGALTGYVAVPRVADALAGVSAPLTSSAPASPVDPQRPIEDQLHIGAAVKRPSVSDAVALLRPTLRFYGSRELASAALANAYAESRFDPYAAGDVDSRGVPQSIGLFQLHSKGAGRNMSIADRVNPERATVRILEEAARAGLPGAAPGSAGVAVWDAFVDLLPGEAQPPADAVSLAQLTARFTVEVERPANSGARAAERVASLRTDSYLRQVLQGLGLPVL